MKNPSVQPGISRTLMIYAIGCLLILLLIEVLSGPLGIPVALGRGLLLVMLVLAPLLAGVLSWTGSRRGGTVSGAERIDEARAVYVLGTAEVDVATREVRFDGAPAEVQPKVFDLVEYLIRARDRVVGKDELFDAIWPSVVVSEASLTQLIKRTRDLFRQHGFDQDVIRTVSRRGYKLDYPVSVVGQAAAAKPASLIYTLLPVILVAMLSLGLGFLFLAEDVPAPQIPPGDLANSSLAVLPFSNLTPDPGFDYFSDGLTETVTDSLTRVRGLRVIARDSSFSFRNADARFGEIAEQLSVGSIVQGSVQRDGEDLRVTARLIRLADGTQLWSQVFDRRYDDIFSLHDDISRAIVDQMSSVLSASLDLPADAELVTGNSDDSEAFRLLLQGQALRRNGSSQDLQSAEALFRRAIEVKPAYADALAALAGTLRVQATIGELPRESAFSEAFGAAQRALDIEPDHAEALVQIGEIQHRHFWQFDAAGAAFQQAIESSPGSASAHSAYSRFLGKAGRHDDAVREARIALDLDPLSTNAASSLVIRLIRADALAEARRVLDDFKDRHPDHFDIPWLETNWHIRNGSDGEALQWIALEELDYLRLSLSAVILNSLGRTGQAQQALDELIESDAEGAAFQIAEVYAQWEAPDLAFEWLERAFRQGDPGLAELYSSVNLENLYADDRFPALAGQIGLPSLPQDN